MTLQINLSLSRPVALEACALRFTNGVFRALLLTTICGAFVACSNTKPTTAGDESLNDHDPHIELIVSEDQKGPVLIEDRPFTVDTLYALMVAELAISRKR